MIAANMAAASTHGECMGFKRMTALLVLVAFAAAAGAQPASRAAAQLRPQADPIPRTLFISNMDTEFRRMDADHDGIVTKKEIEAFQHAQSLAQAQLRNRQLFAGLDS